MRQIIDFIEGLAGTTWFELFTAYIVVLADLEGALCQGSGRMKISLSQQIDEVKRELGERDRVYKRLVATHKMRESVADYQVARMRAVLATLEWFQKHEAKIRAFMGADDGRTGD